MGNEGARIFGMKEAPVPVQKSIDFLVSTVRISHSISALGNASLTDLGCRLMVLLEKRLLAISHLLRARIWSGSPISSSYGSRIGGTVESLLCPREGVPQAVVDDRGQ